MLLSARAYGLMSRQVQRAPALIRQAELRPSQLICSVAIGSHLFLTIELFFWRPTTL